MPNFQKKKNFVMPKSEETIRTLSFAVDVWAIGCILAEMITQRILFPGTDRLDQWTKITDVLGTPPEYFINRLVSLL